ncbi:MAG: hypothetical protein PWP31_1292 [Clostridia bacterium]|nr:hypothetical protein [Clostridia bacterium]
MGMLFGVIFYLIRLLPISFGVNTILNFWITIVIFKLFTSCSLGIAVRSAIVKLLTVVIGETAFVWVFNLFGLSLEELYSSNLMTILSGWPNVILLFAVSLLVVKFNQRKFEGTGQSIEYQQISS